MSANTYHAQTAKLLAQVATCMPPMASEVMQGWIENPKGLTKFLSGLNPLVESKPTLVLIKTTLLDEIAGKKTSDCMAGEPWGYKDSDVDSWLQKKQPALGAGSVGVYQLQNPQGTTFREMAAAALKVGPGTSLDLLARALKEQGHTLTLPAIEQMVEKQEGGEDVGLRTDGWANFVFVEDANGSLSVVYFYRYDGRWRAYVRRLDYGSQWRAELRLLVRNSDALTL